MKCHPTYWDFSRKLLLTAGLEAEIKAHFLHSSVLKLHSLFQQRLANQVQRLWGKRHWSLQHLDWVKNETEAADATPFTLWTIASVQWVVCSSITRCRTHLRMWTKMSQQSRRTMVEKAGQKSGGTGGRRAEEDPIKQRSEWQASRTTSMNVCLCLCVCVTKKRVTFITSLLSPPLLLRLLCLQDVPDINEKSWAEKSRWVFTNCQVPALPCCAEIWNNGKRMDWIQPDALF